MRIDKFRGVKPGTVLEFSDGINLVLGKNATGKTTLLELIVAAVRFDFRRFNSEVLDLTTEAQFDNGWRLIVRTIHKEKQQVLASAIDNESFIQEGNLRLVKDQLSFFVSANGNSLEYDNKGEKVNWQLISLLGLADIYPTRIPESFPKPFVARYSAHGRLDESLEHIHWGMERQIDFKYFSKKASTSQLPPALAVALSNQVRPGADQLVATNERVDYLQHAAELLGVEQVKTTFQFDSQHRTSVDEIVLKYTDQNFTIARGDEIFSFEQFSYGQKRLIAILQYLAANPEVVTADEITNGLHHDWIEEILKMLDGRQCFLTTQNPVLLDYLTFSSADDAKRRMVRCELEENKQLNWRNLTDEEANDFFISSQSGIQHISEIMKTHKLW
jgi:ABC-type dipeptide/oligopeptide/nickel transport system ATPase subunit